jgi:3-oxoacyl-[acyl-carrier-protein] synthase II
MSRRRVVVTGLGGITAVGRTFEDTWQSLLDCKNGIGPIPAGRWDASEFRVRFAGLVPAYDPAEHFPPMVAKKLDYFSQFALLGSDDCLADSGIDLETEDRDRIGVILGTGIGGIMAIEHQHSDHMERGPRRASPHFIPKMMPNAMSAQISIKHGLTGTNYTVNSACASAGHALAVALRTIQSGEQDVVLSGGAEAAVTEVAVSSFAAMKALSTRNDEPDRASRPFDKDRDGFVMGEGSTILMLEEREHALKRGARIYAEFLGYGSTADAHHITQPKEDGIGPRRAMEMALADGGVSADAVQYVNAHGTSTHYNDLVETKAIRQVFGAQADKLAVSSTKSMVGHLLGGSAAVEGAVTCRSIHEGRIHPTRNHEVPGEGCDLDYVPGEARDWAITHAISNSLGFGGHNVCLLFGKHDS